MKIQFILFINCCLFISILTMALGDDARTSLAAGFTLTDGNSETTQANLSLLTELERELLGSMRFGLEVNYGENRTGDKNETTIENGKAYINAKKDLNKKYFAYLNASVQYDDVAQINYRSTLGPGLGLFLVQNEKAALSTEAGLSYVWEDVSDIRDDYVALRVSERIDYQLSDSAKAWQTMEYLSQIDDFSLYLVSGEIGVEAALNSHLNLRVVLQDRYDSEPGFGIEKNDLTLITGISYYF